MLAGEDLEAGVSLQWGEAWECIGVEAWEYIGVEVLGVAEVAEVAGQLVDMVHKSAVGTAVGCIPSRQ
jgi:hypothetical protein